MKCKVWSRLAPSFNDSPQWVHSDFKYKTSQACWRSGLSKTNGTKESYQVTILSHQVMRSADLCDLLSDTPSLLWNSHCQQQRAFNAQSGDDQLKLQQEEIQVASRTNGHKDPAEAQRYKKKTWRKFKVDETDDVFALRMSYLMTRVCSSFFESF